MYNLIGKPLSFKDYDPQDSRWRKFRHNSGPSDFTESFYFDGQYIGSRYGNRYTGRVYRSVLSDSQVFV